MRHRKDVNHERLTQAAERLGWYVLNTSQSEIGFDAIMVKGGRIVFTEIKDGNKPISAQKLTPHEERVHATLKRHGITVEILTCVADLLMLERAHPRRRNYEHEQMGART